MTTEELRYIFRQVCRCKRNSVMRKRWGRNTPPVHKRKRGSRNASSFCVFPSLLQGSPKRLLFLRRETERHVIARSVATWQSVPLPPYGRRTPEGTRLHFPSAKQNRRKPTSIPDAVFLLWTLPRAKNCSPALNFCTRLRTGAALSSPFRLKN